MKAMSRITRNSIERKNKYCEQQHNFYLEMCRREGASLQQGMNFGLGGTHSVILMSLHPNAPYKDQLEDSGTTLVYEGHDMRKSLLCPNPKTIDQPFKYPSGTLTQNGKFDAAAQATRLGTRLPERVRVYEEIRSGIWSYMASFTLLILGLPEINSGRSASSNLSQ